MPAAPKLPKKLIEVALPLDDINVEAAREKSIRHGHPSTLHLWWARRPLAAARAVLFAQLVNDPGGVRGWDSAKGITKEKARQEREKLFELLRELVKWENTTNEELLERARAEIRKSWAETCRITGDDPNKLPPFHDPFAGGGAIPLEAQRLGLEAHASDLNPVAVLINKAMIEIPPRFAGRQPIGPMPPGDSSSDEVQDWRGARGLAEDVRRYGAWMRAEAEKRVGSLYPKVAAVSTVDGWRHATAEELARKDSKVRDLTVIAWLWARTVESPNPAYRGCQVPLASTFWLTTKKGKETWIEPVVDGRDYRFEIRTGIPIDEQAIDNGTKVGRGANFRCLLSGVPISPQHIKAEGMAGRMGVRLMAIAAEGDRSRVYLPPTVDAENLAISAQPEWVPEQKLPNDPRSHWTVSYGLNTYGSLFTSRQLVALTTFSDLVSEARSRVLADSQTSGWYDDGRSLESGGAGPTAYADAVAVYLALAVSRLSDRSSAMCSWDLRDGQGREPGIRNVFSRQSIPMNWDIAETNLFSGIAASADSAFGRTEDVLLRLNGVTPAHAFQADATSEHLPPRVLISTDPPYYDNIGYADLSDYFYVWLRRCLKSVLPSVFDTLLVPKSDELVASPYRHGNRENAEQFFLQGMTRALRGMSERSHPAFPLTIYYAFKQSETRDDTGTASTGWETFLSAVIRAGLAVTGTWPMRTELSNRMIGSGTNALASSIVLVCRRRPVDSPTVARRQFLRDLEESLPEALEEMIHGAHDRSPVAPVDLAQSAIGPGMAVYSQYAAVLEADGEPMTVHTALTLINKAIDEYFTAAESDMDAETRFCVAWCQTYGFKPGAFGEADVLARAKGTAVESLVTSGVAESGGGKVRLFRPAEYPADWNPQQDSRVPIWEACHQIVRALGGSETVAGTLLAKMPDKAEAIRQLAYRLFTICERAKRAEEAGTYNALIASWPAITEAAQAVGTRGEQTEFA